MGLKRLDLLAAAAVRGEEQRLQTVEEGRLALFVGGAEHVQPIGQPLDLDGRGEAAQVLDGDPAEFHAGCSVT